MNKIIDGKGTGKTRKLLELAKANNRIVVCENIDNMIKRSHRLGIAGIEFMNYSEYVHNINSLKKPVYIINLDNFIKSFDNDIDGYSLTLEDLK